MNLVRFHHDLETLQPRNEISIGDRIRAGARFANEAWLLVILRSNEYQKALDLRDRDVEAMEHLDSVIVVSLENRPEIYLVAKSTCGSPYGGTWTTLIQPRIQGINIPGLGGGTTFIAALSEEYHRLILEAISNNKTSIQSKHIWP